jgi:hypothetical protein
MHVSVEVLVTGRAGPLRTIVAHTVMGVGRKTFPFEGTAARAEAEEAAPYLIPLQVKLIGARQGLAFAEVSVARRRLGIFSHIGDPARLGVGAGGDEQQYHQSEQPNQNAAKRQGNGLR